MLWNGWKKSSSPFLQVWAGMIIIKWAPFFITWNPPISALPWWRSLVGILLRTWRVHSQGPSLGVSQPSMRPWLKLQAPLFICNQGSAAITLLNQHWKTTGHRVCSLQTNTAKYPTLGWHVLISLSTLNEFLSETSPFLSSKRREERAF